MSRDSWICAPRLGYGRFVAGELLARKELDYDAVVRLEEERALSPEAEELLRRRAAEVGFSTLDWIVELLEPHAEQDEEGEPEDEE